MSNTMGPPDDFDGRFSGGGGKSASSGKVVIAEVGEIAVPAYIDGDFEPTPNLNAAIALAQTKVTSVAKGGENTFQKYKYPTHDDMKEMLAPVLGECGLSYEQHEVSIKEFSDNLVAGIYLFRVCHSSGERGPLERVTAFALKSNRGGADEKSISKIRTQAWKDWAKGRFCVSAGDPPSEDPDFGHHEDDAPRGRQQSGGPAGRSPAMDKLAANNVRSVQPPKQQPGTDDAVKRQQEDAANGAAKAGEFAESVKDGISRAADEDGVIKFLTNDRNTATKIGLVKKKYLGVYKELIALCIQPGVFEKMSLLETSPTLSEFYTDITDAAVDTANNDISGKKAA